MPESAPPPLDYQATILRPRPLAWRWHLAVIIATAVIFTLVTVPLLFVIPSFETIFKDFKTELPTITRIVLTISAWFRNDFGFFFLLPLPAIVVGLGFLLDRNAPSDDRIKRYACMVLILALLFALFFAAFIAISLFAPMTTLVNSVNASEGKK